MTATQTYQGHNLESAIMRPDRVSYSGELRGYTGSGNIPQEEAPKEAQTPEQIAQQVIQMFGKENVDPNKLAASWMKQMGTGIPNPDQVGMMQKDQAWLDYENYVTKSVTNNVLMKYLIGGGNFDALANMMVEKPQVSKGALDKKLATGPLQMPLPPIPDADRQMLSTVISTTIGNTLKSAFAAFKGGDSQYYASMAPGNVAQSVAEMSQILNTSLEQNIKKRETIDQINMQLLDKYGNDVNMMQADYEKRSDAAAWMYNQAKIAYANNAFNQAQQMLGLQGNLASRNFEFDKTNKNIESGNVAVRNQFKLARAQQLNALKMLALRQSAMETKYNLPETWKKSVEGIPAFAATIKSPNSVGILTKTFEGIDRQIKKYGVSGVSRVWDSAAASTNETLGRARDVFGTSPEGAKQWETFLANYTSSKKQLVGLTHDQIRVMGSARMPEVSRVSPTAVDDTFSFLNNYPDNPDYADVQGWAMAFNSGGAGLSFKETFSATGMKGQDVKIERAQQSWGGEEGEEN